LAAVARPTHCLQPILDPWLECSAQLIHGDIMNTTSRNIAFIAAAVGLTASSAGFSADPNQAERYGRDSVTVWNSPMPLSPHTAMPATVTPPGGTPVLGYGRAGGPAPSFPLSPPAREPVYATRAERYGRA
jgi:hypothetical protein